MISFFSSRLVLALVFLTPVISSGTVLKILPSFSSHSLSAFSSDEIYKKVYGSTRYFTHFNSNTPMRSYDQINSGSSFLACSDYSHATMTRNSLQDVYGEMNVHTSYLSENQQIACFILMTSSSKRLQGEMSLSALMERNIHLRSVKNECSESLTYRLPPPLPPLVTWNPFLII
jgi:hypothetical protein